jgi:arsenate reductase-like glutaredoxin family protein
MYPAAHIVENSLMANIDWMYSRKSCVTCKKARDYLGQTEVEVVETVDPTKVRYDSEEALALLKGIDKLIAAKGKKVDVFDLKRDRPEDDVLLAHLMGPSGNLRAPTVRIGKVLVVGFNEDAYKQVFKA